jgi:hypothetical protein
VRQKNTERRSGALKTSETKLVHSAPCKYGLDSVPAARTLHFADIVLDEATDLYHFATADYHNGSTSTEVENVLHCNVAPHTTGLQHEEGQPIGVEKDVVQKEHLISHAASVEVSAQGSALLADKPTLQVGPDKSRSPRLSASAVVPESQVASSSKIQTGEDLERIVVGHKNN